MKHVVAAIVVVVALVAAFAPERGVQPAPVKGEFATFEKRIRADVWGKGSEKIRLKDFENTRQALDWMKAEWPKVEGEVFLPLDKEEAIAGQDLDALSALWERWSK